MYLNELKTMPGVFFEVQEETVKYASDVECHCRSCLKTIEQDDLVHLIKREHRPVHADGILDEYGNPYTFELEDYYLCVPCGVLYSVLSEAGYAPPYDINLAEYFATISQST